MEIIDIKQSQQESEAIQIFAQSTQEKFERKGSQIQQNNIHNVSETNQQQIISPNSKQIKLDQQAIVERKSKNNLFQQQNEFNFDRIPPDWIYAEDHLKARVIGPEVHTTPVNICDCCGFNVTREQLPLKCNILDLSFLGSGFPLLFLFIKFCIIIAAIFLVMSGMFNLISNATQDDCLSDKEIKQILLENPKCENYTEIQIIAKVDEISTHPNFCDDEFFNTISLANKKNSGKIMLAQSLLNMITVIVILIILYYFRRVQRKMDVECDEANISPSDFTIWVRNIPCKLQNFDYDDSIKEFFEVECSKLLNQKLTVKLISLGFDLTELEQAHKNKNSVLKQKQLKIAQQNKNGGIWPEDGLNLEQFDIEIKNMDQKIQEVENSMIEGVSDSFCGTAYISFQTEQQKKLVLERYGIQQKQKLIFQGSPLEIRQSPEPNAIL